MIPEDIEPAVRTEGRLLPASMWVLPACAAALPAALVFARMGAGGRGPRVEILLASAAAIGLLTTGGLYLGIRRGLSLPARVALYAVAYNTLVIAAKFVLGPLAVYEVNRSRALTGWFRIDEPLGAVLTACLVFALYAIGYSVIYVFYRRRMRAWSRLEAPEKQLKLRRAVLPALMGVILVAAGGVVVVPAALLIALGGGLEYLQFVFGSSFAILIALALTGASSLLAVAFGSAERQARLVGDAAILSSFFWLGLYLLALYHVLWVVYILVLTTIWPLKVVVPK